MSVSAILLAAGSSRRFGADNKLLAPIGGAPIIRVVAQALDATRASEIIVVTGADADAIRLALDGLDVRMVENPAHEDGIGRSIAAGVAVVDKRATGAIIVPADMPFLTAALVDALIAAFETGGEHRAVVPITSEGEQRNPVLWPRRFFHDLMRLDGDKGGKALLAQHSHDCDVLIVEDEVVFRDIDTLGELAAIAE